MTGQKLLVANRGEIAIRIFRSAADLGMGSVAVYPADDSASLHVEKADAAIALPGRGVAAYLDGAAILRAAREAGATAINPGYGFLSENAAFARACAEAGVTFVGPTPEILELFGDKHQARQLVRKIGVPTLPGTAAPTTLEEARAFMAGLGADAAVMVKAVAGGGGRGMRPVLAADDLEEAFVRCRSEATAAFGSGDLYVEQLVRHARHIEVQVIGDGAEVAHLWERDCSLQRQRQKLVEFAPAPNLEAGVRQRLLDAALALARAANYRSLGTFEFLVDGASGAFYFIEANPRLQVEHTVTEEVMGVDLVQTQFRLAAGEQLAALGLTQEAAGRPRGLAVQLRVNMERIAADGAATPTGGTLSAFDPPGGAGIRVESFGYAGYRTSSSFDSLIAKVIAFTPTGRLEDALIRADRALAEFRIAGVVTNKDFLRGLIQRPDVKTAAFDTGFVERHAAELVGAAAVQAELSPAADRAGATAAAAGQVQGPAGTVGVPAPMGGRLVGFEVAEGATVKAGAAVAIIEAMKMEHLVTAEMSGTVRLIAAAPGDTVAADQPLVFIEPSEVDGAHDVDDAAHGPGHVRADLAEALARNAALLDHMRPDAVARRRKTGQRTARENIDDLCDADSFVEYGGLALAAQRRRRTVEELTAMSPADGLIAGIGAVNGALFGEAEARCMVMSYDYTVFAGTQGFMNHKKMDRMLRLAGEWRLPLVMFAEGGGGRPGETDFMGVAGLDLQTFRMLAELSGAAPTVAIVSGRCFAGNAAVAGCCDVIIATENANLGMGGPAMIEGGGLGVFKPEEVGPMSVQAPNGVVDLLVKDEAAAVAAAKQYLSYFQGPVADWQCADQELLRQAIPENRLRAYDVRTVITLLADTGSVMELRPAHGIGMITALIRVEGRPMGLIANNPRHLGGAIDAEGAEKGARFIELCEAYGLPVLSLCDTPGFMVGPEAETTALVRRVSRLFLSGANATVPVLTIVLRKGYGLGAQGMAAGSFHAPLFIVSWPTGEFGGMGLEGAVRLGYRNELAAIADPAEREAVYQRHVDELYERGKAISAASFLEIDGVIDPAQSRHWIIRGLKSVPKPEQTGKRRPFVAPR